MSDEAAATNDTSLGDMSEPSSSHSDCSSHEASDSHSSTAESLGVPELPCNTAVQTSACGDSTACHDKRVSNGGITVTVPNSCFSEHSTIAVCKLVFV